MVHFIQENGVVINISQVVSVEMEEGYCTVYTTATTAQNLPLRYTFQGAAAWRVKRFFLGLAQDLAAEQVEK